MTTKLIDIITRVKEQQVEIKEISRLMLGNYSKHESIFNDNLENLKLIVIEIIINSSSDPIFQLEGRNQIVSEYNKVFVDWQNNGAKTGYHSTYSELVKKIMTLNNKYSRTDFAARTIRSLDLCEQAYVNVEKIDKFLVQIYNDFSFFHRKISRIVKVIEKNL